MSIVRKPKPTNNFYVLDKSISEDNTISWEASGLLIYLLGKPDNWSTNIAHLSKIRQAGRDKISRMLNELIDAGYVARSQGRSENGQMEKVSYEVSEVKSPQLEKPLTENPQPEKPLTANPPLISIEDKQVLNVTSTDNNSCVAEQNQRTKTNYENEFEHIKAIYPPREGSQAWQEALKGYQARRRQGYSFEALLAATGRYRAFSETKGNLNTSFVMQAKRFFGKDLEFNNTWSVNHAVNQPSRSVNRSLAACDAYREKLRRQCEIEVAVQPGTGELLAGNLGDHDPAEGAIIC